MLFPSLNFLVFFAVSTAAYFLLPGQRARQVLLFGACCFFYASFIPAYLIILLVLIAFNYAAARGIECGTGILRKAGLLFCLAVNLGVLFFFKYWDFAAAQANLFLGGKSFHAAKWVLPLGISFYTFQALAYLIETYRGRPAERDPLIYALYILFYPQLVAGPIERPGHLIPQLSVYRPFDPDNVRAGLRRMLWGFFKKIAIADRLGYFVQIAYASPQDAGGIDLAIATYFFAIQIYCDFSGYCDIALGAAQVLGIRLSENFDRPYAAASPMEFWRRWHKTLMQWFRDYVYLPLGGSRCGRVIFWRNGMLVFVLSGLWHGAGWTFLLWGLYHAVLYLTARAAQPWTKKWPSWLGVILTFHAVLLGWILFRASSLGDAGEIFSRLLTLAPGTFAFDKGGQFATAVFFAVFILPAESLAGRRIWNEKILSAPRPLRWAFYYAAILIMLLAGIRTAQPFIYFQF